MRMGTDAPGERSRVRSWSAAPWTACLAVGCQASAMSVAEPGRDMPPAAPPSVDGGAPARGPADADPYRPPDPDECAAVNVEAPPATPAMVDIICVVDASGSMFDEQKRIADNIAEFASRVTGASLDYRIVMLTQRASGVSGTVCRNGVCMPAEGICGIDGDDPAEGTPLDGDPDYLFVRSNVLSENSLGIALRRFPDYASFLRSDSVVHFVVVTDDENNPAEGGVEKDEFSRRMRANLGRDFIFHAVASEDTGGGRPCGNGLFGLGAINPETCESEPSATAPGATYYALA